MIHPPLPPGDLLPRLAGETALAGAAVKVLARSGVIRPYAPWTLAALGATLLRWGTGPAGGFATMALREPRRVALLDERGSLTFGDLHARSNALARGLGELGVQAGDSVAVMCRNHRGFVDATLAVAKLGADVLYLNTAFAGPQLADVLDRERPRLVVLDEEFEGLLPGTRPEQRLLAWTDSGRPEGLTLEALIAAYPSGDLRPPDRRPRTVILTSGTTGEPKGAPRGEAGLEAVVAVLDRIPLRFGWTSHVAAPLFHTWGFAHLSLAMLLGSAVVLRRRFDAAECLGVLEEERCDSLAVIPVMLQRMLSLPEEVLAEADLSRLKVVAASGSALSGDLAVTWMDRFGDNLYNIYGSTEVFYASIATPGDLRAAPTSAGRPPFGTRVRILDHDGHQVPAEHPGRIFVGNSMLFEGYSGGGHKEVVDGLMSTGDVGRFGPDGRLYVEGRDDEMIVSGGENVFPSEVEHCLARHPAVLEATAVGVADEEFGQRLKAFVAVSDPAVSEEELKSWVASHLARYKVPREIVFLDELPRNATGKILKRVLHRDGER
ncbi:MAG TPA: AMP-binding protein [Nocardioides sp.]|uniref:AMP-binding protein n=1 Tax=Nocardioides sp. TaxID=35761 RepID=UPI002CFB9A0E|nr:AMP-binding protein [Nocardioides sp.]HQR26477.1 AMP-binding protein [Nocardioides sp.]